MWLIRQCTIKLGLAKNTSMTRSDLIELLAKRFSQLTTDDTEFAVKSIIDAIAQTLTNKRRIEIRGFGGFSTTFRRARTSRNPKTGKLVQIPAKYVPHFKPGKELRERIDAPTAR